MRPPLLKPMQLHAFGRAANLTGPLLSVAYKKFHSLLCQGEAELAQVVHQLAYNTFFGPKGADGFSAKPAASEEAVARWKGLMAGLARVGVTGQGFSATRIRFVHVE